jgi:hypothetical protein
MNFDEGVCLMKFSIVLAFASLALVGCSNTNTSPVRPESTTSASSTSLTASPSATAAAVHPTPDAGFGFNGTVSGFLTGKVFVSGGGTFDLASGFVRASGGFSCLLDVLQGPFNMPKNGNGPCLMGQGVRWDTAQLLPNAPNGFKCTGADAAKPAVTGDKLVVLLADFYRAGDANDESFTAQMIVSENDIAPNNEFPGANLWVQGVGCGHATVNFSH